MVKLVWMLIAKGGGGVDIIDGRQVWDRWIGFDFPDTTAIFTEFEGGFRHYRLLKHFQMLTFEMRLDSSVKRQG